MKRHACILAWQWSHSRSMMKQMKSSETLLVAVTASVAFLLIACPESVYPTAEMPTLQSSERGDISFGRADANWAPAEPVSDATASPVDIPVADDAVVPADVDASPPRCPCVSPLMSMRQR